MSVGSMTDISQLGKLPENIKVYNSVDQIEVLQKADVGAGIYLDKNNIALIKSAIEQVLSDESYKKKAAVIAESFRKSGGALAAADAILRVAEGK